MKEGRGHITTGASQIVCDGLWIERTAPDTLQVGRIGDSTPVMRVFLGVDKTLTLETEWMRERRADTLRRRWWERLLDSKGIKPYRLRAHVPPRFVQEEEDVIEWLRAIALEQVRVHGIGDAARRQLRESMERAWPRVRWPVDAPPDVE